MNERPYWQKFFEHQVTKTVGIVLATIAVTSYFNAPVTQNTQRIAGLEDANVALKAQIQNIKDNDLHTIEGKQTVETDAINDLKSQIIELKTIINERIPKR